MSDQSLLTKVITHSKKLLYVLIENVTLIYCISKYIDIQFLLQQNHQYLQIKLPLSINQYSINIKQKIFKKFLKKISFLFFIFINDTLYDTYHLPKTKRYQNSIVLQTLIFSQVPRLRDSTPCIIVSQYFQYKYSCQKLNFANLLFYQHITISKRQLITDLMIVPITISNNHTNYSPILTIQHIKSHFQYILGKYFQQKYYFISKFYKNINAFVGYINVYSIRQKGLLLIKQKYCLATFIKVPTNQIANLSKYRKVWYIKIQENHLQNTSLNKFQIFNSDRKPFLFFCHFFSQIAIRCEQKKVQRNFVSQSFLTYTVIMQLTSGRFAYDFTTGKSSWIYIVYQDCKHQILLLLVFVKQLIILVRVKFQLKRESRSKNLDQTYLHKMYNPNCNTINRKNQNHMQIARSQFTLLSVSVTDKIYGYSCRIQSTHILKPVKIIKTQDRHQCLTYLTINQIIEFPLRIFFQYILKV
eukprot:TRINITY_DN622_c0_g1_i7.p1 TRINITY_DN622_c0_g1~~TRINITY_DN622_c0_g1_i7.p1  ORF type:complete len:471 (-),score=-68.80 TRINITY_DN622_c0_g1_i7:95-1507(-)